MSKSTIFKISFIFLWILLFAGLLHRDYFIDTVDVRETRLLQKDREESFLGIYFQKQRIGYVKNRFASNGENSITLQQEAFMMLNILNQKHPIRMKVTADLDPSFLLQGFTFRISSPFYKMVANGEVDGSTVHFVLQTGKDKVVDKVRLSKPPYLSTNRRSYLLREGLEKGDKLKIPYFDPISLSGKDTILEYYGKEKVLILGRVYNLHHFTENYSGVWINSWIDDQGRLMKEESPAGFVFISEPEFKATDIVAKGTEILSAVSVPITGKMPSLEGLESIRYRLSFPEDVSFSLDQDRQSLDDSVLTVRLEAVPNFEAAICDNAEIDLAPTPYIQSGHDKIMVLSKQLAGHADSPLAVVESLASWVYTSLEKRPVIGIPDALTTLDSLRGDCNEHSALFAALARSGGIPTRVAAGVTLHEGAFFYHAWNEVCIGNTWISLDTTKNQFPADLSHIKFIDGELAEQVKIGALIGKLGIEVLDFQRRSP